VAAEIAYSGRSRTAVAEAIGLDKASFSRSIAGNRQWKASEIIDIASTLDIPVSYLMEPRRPNTTPDQGGSPSACNDDALILKFPSTAQVAA
jgi:hypothetical protein